jgi:hypothetical protein
MLIYRNPTRHRINTFVEIIFCLVELGRFLFLFFLASSDSKYEQNGEAGKYC